MRDSVHKGVFINIYIEDDLWQQINKTHIRSRLAKIIEKIELYYHETLLKGRGNHDSIRSILGEGNYKIRFDYSTRLPFRIYHNEQEELCLILGKLLSHQEGQQLHTQAYPFENLQALNLEGEMSQLETENIPAKYQPFSGIYRVWSFAEERRLLNNVKADLRCALNQAQQTFLNADGPILLKGTAGSGKTTVAIYRLIKSSATEKVYLTYTSPLKEHAQHIFESLTIGLNVSQPIFLTLEELCLELMGEGEEFPLSQKMTFSIFKDLSFVQKTTQQHKIEASILWEEIRGVIKQYSTPLSRPEYLQIADNYSKEDNNGKIAGIVYQVYQQYQGYLEQFKMWDDIDLAKAALKISRQRDSMRYDEIIVDEVQDLTKVHIEMITRLCTSPHGLFFAGDEAQSIHPSKFNWREIESQIIDTLAEIHHQYKTFKALHRLTDNYRTPDKIFELVKTLQLWRNEAMGETSDIVNIKTYKTSLEDVHLIDLQNFKNFQQNVVPSSVMVIVIFEEYKPIAQAKFGKGSVFTIYEAKGLENKDIILYGFFDDPFVSKSFERFKQFFSILARRRNYITLLNFLHVAITRAEYRLFIVSNPKNVRQLEPLKDFPFQENDGRDLKNILADKSDTAEQYFILAGKLELAGNLEQAEANYRQAGVLGHPLGNAFASKCLGLMAKAKHDYQGAINWLELALDIDDNSILKQYDESRGLLALEQGNLEDAITFLLNAELPYNTIIYRICSNSNPKRYNIVFPLVLKLSLAEQERFFQKYQKGINLLTLSLAEIWKMSHKNTKVTHLYLKYKWQEIQDKLGVIKTKLKNTQQALETVLQQLSQQEMINSSPRSLAVTRLLEELKQKIQTLDSILKNTPQIPENYQGGLSLIENYDKLIEDTNLYPEWLDNFYWRMAKHPTSLVRQGVWYSPHSSEAMVKEVIRKLRENELFQTLPLLINSSWLSSEILQEFLQKNPNSKIIKNLIKSPVISTNSSYLKACRTYQVHLYRTTLNEWQSLLSKLERELQNIGNHSTLKNLDLLQERDTLLKRLKPEKDFIDKYSRLKDDVINSEKFNPFMVKLENQIEDLSFRMNKLLSMIAHSHHLDIRHILLKLAPNEKLINQKSYSKLLAQVQDNEQ